MMEENICELELRAILETSNDNIVITDGKGKVLRSSPNCQSIYGLKIEELIGKTVDDLEKMEVFSPSVYKKSASRKERNPGDAAYAHGPYSHGDCFACF